MKINFRIFNYNLEILTTRELKLLLYILNKFDKVKEIKIEYKEIRKFCKINNLTNTFLFLKNFKEKMREIGFITNENEIFYIFNIKQVEKILEISINTKGIFLINSLTGQETTLKSVSEYKCKQALLLLLYLNATTNTVLVNNKEKIEIEYNFFKKIIGLKGKENETFDKRMLKKILENLSKDFKIIKINKVFENIKGTEKKIIKKIVIEFERL